MVAVHDYAPSVDSPNPQPELELAFTKGQFITIYGDMVSYAVQWRLIGTLAPCILPM